ncbi:cytochrome C biogenesis protein [Patescibacteria group bacterium]|nr:cytochrome C biogenesis protein [Patescibacteria group bacterium]
MSNKEKVSLVSIAFVLFSIILLGLFYLTKSGQTVSLTLAYAAGLSMIFLPCTLPLAFIIVPLTMGEKPKKGIIMAVLFGLGVSITLSFYGVFMAVIGQYLGLDSATRIMFTIAGTAALLFGISELRLIKWTVPSFSGALPSFIQRQGEYLRVFTMGLFLGNAGVGCPNPAFYVLLGYIATVGEIGTGWLLGFVHGLGRATPLIFLAILGILGVNATGFLTTKKQVVDKLMGWALVFVGSFILTYGVFGMPWWEDSVFHASWNKFIFNIAPQLAEAPGHPVAQGLFVAPFWAGWTLFLGLVGISILWATSKKMVSRKKALLIVAFLFGLIILAISGTIEAEHKHGIDDVHTDDPPSLDSFGGAREVGGHD